MAPIPRTDELSVHNPLSAGRRLASRAVAWQAGATALVALALLAFGVPHALGALVGGGAVAAGGWLSRAISLGGGIAPAGGALARLLAGAMLKWVLVFGVLALGIGLGGFPPLAVLAGVLVALVVQVLAMASQ
ncbi:MAG: hypothetical protein R3278_03125 [Lysobacter spongiicola]|nr:hypothetical protein [Lysobacter spongiicola]